MLPIRNAGKPPAPASVSRDVIAALIDGDNGRPIYIATLGAWTKALDSLEELERFVERVEGARQ